MLLTERFRIYGEDDRFLAMGVAAHEFGHMLFGLPDYGYSVSYWGIMGMGAYGYGPGGLNNNDPEKPVHPCAISRIQAGFADVQTISGEGAIQHQYTLPAVELAGKILHLDNQDNDTNFYLEVRQPRGNVFDSDIKRDSAGLVVWFTFEQGYNNIDGYFPDLPTWLYPENVGYFDSTADGPCWPGYWGQPTESAYPGPENNTEIGYNTVPSFTGNLYTSLHHITNIQKLFVDINRTANAAQPIVLGVRFDLERFYFDENIFSISLDDDNQGLSQGNGNGSPEVGERIEVVFRIINGGAEAMPQTSAAFLTDEDLDLLSDPFFIAQIPPGEYVDTPVMVFDVLTEPTSEDYYLVSLLRSDNFKFTTAGLFGIALHPGWPQATGGWIRSSPALADLDNDGDMEIVVGSDDNNVYAWHHDGTPVEGWPVTTGNSVASSPAIADIDNDSDLEIVVGSYDMNVYAWHHDGTPVEGWPVAVDSYVFASPAIADIDNDSYPEIIVGTESAWYMSSGAVYAWHHDGSLVEGWPQESINHYDSFRASPAVADLNNDGIMEIAIGSQEGYFYVWHADGTLMDGWPLETSADGIASSAALADLDNDSDLEIIVGSNWDWNSHKAYLLVWHHDGTPVEGWPQESIDNYDSFVSSPAVADLDGDGALEIVIGTQWRGLYVWHADGTLMDGWPIFDVNPANTESSSPAIANLDNDSDLEIVVGCYDGKVYAWHHDASIVTGWPTPTGDAIYSSPAIADIDNDGALEIVVGSSDHKVYVWSYGISQPGKIEWPMFRRDLQNTGLYPRTKKSKLREAQPWYP